MTQKELELMARALADRNMMVIAEAWAHYGFPQYPFPHHGKKGMDAWLVAFINAYCSRIRKISKEEYKKALSYYIREARKSWGWETDKEDIKRILEGK